MTESEWLASEDVAAMLAWLTGPTRRGMPDRPGYTDRKLRLWVEACRESRPPVTINSVGLDTPAGLRDAVEYWSGPNGWEPVVSPALRAALLREIVGNPFRPPRLPSGKLPCPDCEPGCPEEYCDDCSGEGWVRGPCPWLTPTVLGLARTIYDTRQWELMPILGDALEDAFCDDAEILGHCRGPGPHVAGCWCLCLILGTD